MATRSTLADFEIVTRLGSGSFGTVFKVRRYIDEKIYVIKNVRIAELSFKEQSDAINEVQILAQLKSPYVVRYYDSFIENNCLHIVMEFCNRGDLQNLIKKAKSKNVAGLQENVIWNVMLQIMLGLHYLHRKHILHRDLKSANVFLMKDESRAHYLVKIGDLGVAKLMDTSTALANTIVGTPYYLSPELCADLPYRDKSDCWALGVLCFECATLQHPFEARNQCALIMKIIEAQVKIPSNLQLSSDLRNLILWLLRKDPNARPSIKDILNERVVRERLVEHQFDVPEELRDAKITDTLTLPGFEKKEGLKKKQSGIQLMNMRHQEEQNNGAAPTGTAAAAASATGNVDKEKVSKEGAKKPALQPPPKQRETSTTQLRIGGEATPASPSVNRGVRRTGSTTANLEHKADNNTSDGQMLSVAGNGMGSRNTSNNNLAPSPHNVVPPRGTSFRNTGTGVGGTGNGDGAAIRGDRVRGPSFNRRVPSEKAMSRYQVRPPPLSNQTSARLSDSKLDTNADEGDAEVAQYKEDEYDGEVDVAVDAPAEDKAAAMEGTGEAGRQGSMRGASLRPVRSSPQLEPSMNDARADSKEGTEYEEDFEDYEPTPPPPQRPGDEQPVGVADARNYGTSLTASRKLSFDDVGSAQDKHERRPSQEETTSRLAGMKLDYPIEDKPNHGVTSDLMAFNSSRSQRFTGTSDPFHTTDNSTLPDHEDYTSTMAGENELWDAVWTQRRGVIGDSGRQDFGSADLYARPEGIEEDAKGEAGEYEEEDDGNAEEGGGGNSPDDVAELLDVISNLKNGAIAICGENLFWKVYDLCVKYRDIAAEGGDTAGLLPELEEILAADGCSLEKGCEAAFMVNKMVNFEFVYNAHLDSKSGRA